MIILDTNVLSELTRPAPEPAVLAWVDGRPTQELATTAVTAAELRYGVARLPRGRRRSRLESAVRDMLEIDFRDRVQPFDAAAAEEYPAVVTARDRLGRPITLADAQITAICRAHDVALATRNTRAPVARSAATAAVIVKPPRPVAKKKPPLCR